MDPRYAQAMQLFAAGRFDAARPMLLALVQRDPSDARAVMYLAQCCAQLNLIDQAAFHGQRMTQLMPNVPQAWTFFAKILHAAGKIDRAIAAADRALDVSPPHGLEIPVISDLLWLVAQANAYPLGLRTCAHALRGRPDDPILLAQHASYLGHVGRLAESREAFLHLAAIHPDGLPTLHGLAWQSIYDPDLDPQTVFNHHRDYGLALHRIAAALPPSAPGSAFAPPTPDPAAGRDRPLCVGLLSSDLRRHSCAYFARALIEHHAAAGIDLRVYCTNTTNDDLTDLFRAAVPADRWFNLAPLKPVARAEVIAADRPDVLVCLSGLYVDESMAVLARRPAPVQIDYMGYPHTSGLPTVDFRFVDSHTDPAPHADALATERLLRLDPCFLAYTPPPDAPPVTPREPDAPITFISCNNGMKHNDAVFRVWAGILAAVPGSRLRIKTRGLEHASTHAETLARLVAAGAKPEALELTGWTKDRASHLAVYSAADIALDPFPYHGTTTTCEALLMGVPVITLAGQQHASRVGVSLLSAVGLTEFIAHDAAEYARLTIALAHDAPRRAALRATLRARLLASPLGDGPGFARRFAQAALAAHQTILNR
jgi:protein O-GlcNAc transferase